MDLLGDKRLVAGPLHAGSGDDIVSGMDGNDSVADTSASCCRPAGVSTGSIAVQATTASPRTVRGVVIGGAEFDTARMDRGDGDDIEP